MSAGDKVFTEQAITFALTGSWNYKRMKTVPLTNGITSSLASGAGRESGSP
jgi:hypothetical protein